MTKLCQYKKPQASLITLVLILTSLFSEFVLAKKLKIHEKKHSGFHLVSGSDFNSLLVRDPALFNKTDQIILGGLSFDYLKIKKSKRIRSDKGKMINLRIDRSWKIGDSYKNTLRKAYARQAKVVFNEESEFKLSDKPTKNSLTVMLLLTEFQPDVELNPSKTFGASAEIRKLGNAKFRIVIQNSSNKDIIAVMDGQAEVTNGQLINNTKVGHSNAWEGSFYDWHNYLLETMVAIKSLN